MTGTENHPYYRFFAMAKGLTEGRVEPPGGGHYVVKQLRRQSGWGPWDATAFANLAMAQHRLGRGDEAKASLSKATAIMTQKMPDPAKGRLFPSWGWLDAVHAQVATVRPRNY